VVAPALADLEFDPGRKPLARIVNRVAVLRAVLGGLAGELKRDTGTFVLLTLVPTAYYLCLLTLCFDAVKTWSGFFSLTGMVVAMSCVPVLVCFWPSRHRVRVSD